MISLHAYLVRKPGLTHAEFRRYWHDQHGPLIRDTPELARRLLRYEQHPRLDGQATVGPGGVDYDGVAIQSFASWDDFLAFIDGPAAEAMRADEANFLDHDQLTVVFTDDPVVVVADRSAGVPGG